MKTQGNVNYNEVIYLNGLFNNLSILSMEKEIRASIHKLKKDLSTLMNDFKEERDFIFLMNDGEEKSDQQGNKYLDMPSYKLRKDFTGSDEDYKKHLLSTRTIKETIYKALQDLGDRLTNYTLKPFLTEKQFEDLLEKIQSTEFDSLRDKLIIK